MSGSGSDEGEIESGDGCKMGKLTGKEGGLMFL